jgi:hypothetical protein
MTPARYRQQHVMCSCDGEVSAVGLTWSVTLDVVPRCTADCPGCGSTCFPSDSSLGRRLLGWRAADTIADPLALMPFWPTEVSTPTLDTAPNHDEFRLGQICWEERPRPPRRKSLDHYWCIVRAGTCNCSDISQTRRNRHLRGQATVEGDRWDTSQPGRQEHICADGCVGRS